MGRDTRVEMGKVQQHQQGEPCVQVCPSALHDVQHVCTCKCWVCACVWYAQYACATLVCACMFISVCCMCAYLVCVRGVFSASGFWCVCVFMGM